MSIEHVKICPFMSKPATHSWNDDHPQILQSELEIVSCKEKECMAWGTYFIDGKENHYCKLIDKK